MPCPWPAWHIAPNSSSYIVYFFLTDVNCSQPLSFRLTVPVWSKPITRRLELMHQPVQCNQLILALWTFTISIQRINSLVLWVMRLYARKYDIARELWEITRNTLNLKWGTELGQPVFLLRFWHFFSYWKFINILLKMSRFILSYPICIITQSVNVYTKDQHQAL